MKNHDDLVIYHSLFWYTNDFDDKRFGYLNFDSYNISNNDTYALQLYFFFMICAFHQNLDLMELFVLHYTIMILNIFIFPDHNIFM